MVEASEIGKGSNISGDIEKSSDYIVSLFEKHGIFPKKGCSTIRDKSCCAVGIVSKELGDEYGGSSKFMDEYGANLMWGIIFGFDGIDYLSNNLKILHQRVTKGYEIGKRTYEKLLEQGKIES